MGRVEGKVALVTGAALGQGRAHSIRMAEEGADLVLVDALQDHAAVPYPMGTEADLDETVRRVEALDRRVHTVRADVRDRVAMDAAVAQAFERYGRLDVVVANVGVCPGASTFWEIDADRWDTIVGICLRGVLNTVSAAAPRLIEQGTGGSVVVTSSLLGLKGSRGLADYVAAKHGVIGLMKSMALELAAHMIRVNAVCPNSVDTNMIDNETMIRAFRPDLENPTREDTVAGFTSLGELPVPWLDPVDIANAVLYLASDEARYVTGVALPVDAGMTVK